MSTGNIAAFRACARAVAIELLGEPNRAQSTKTELRWGNRGAFCLDLQKGTWFDNETGSGGGVVDLVMREQNLDKAGAAKWLTDHGHLEKRERNNSPSLDSPQKARIVAEYDYRDERDA
mgnify:CR=1 FL=1